MHSVTFSAATLALLFQQSFAYEVPKLTAINYDELTAGKTVFIKAFAPWCGHCKAMAGDWETLAEEYKDHAVGLVAEIDCTEEEALCEKLAVQGFPTLFYGDADDLEQYEGDRSLEAMTEFAKEHITKPTCSLAKIDSCSDEQKKVVEELRAKSKDDLGASLKKADEEIKTLNEEFHSKVEELQAAYEKMSADLQEGLTKVKDESDYKWLTKIFVEKGGEIEEEPGMGDEF